MNKKINRQYILILGILYFGCALFILLFSYSTSILYPYYFGNDSAHFLTMGLAWKNGKIPYRDLFEHKGPLIYFIDFLGFCLTDSKSGVSLIQFIFLCATITAVFHISLLYKNSYQWGFLSCALFLIAIKANYQEGNSVEEYCLPFLFWSVYGLIKWYHGEHQQHPALWSLLYGFTCGVCLLTRATNAVPLTGGLLLIIITLLYKKSFRNLIKNLLYGLGGFLLCIAPFCIYFASKNALSDMIYDSFIFNIAYTSGCSAWYIGAPSTNVANHLQNYYLYHIIFLLAAVKLFQKKYYSASACLITAFFETILFMNNNDYIQYPLVCLPQFVLLINEVLQLCESGKKEYLILSFFLLFRTGTFLHSIVTENMVLAIDAYHSGHTHIVRNWEPLMDLIPEEEKASFALWSDVSHMDQQKELYLLQNITPACKYYMTQPWLAGFSDQIKTDICQTYQNTELKWILCDGDTSLIDPVLEEKYELYAIWDTYRLYHLAD